MWGHISIFLIFFNFEPPAFKIILRKCIPREFSPYITHSKEEKILFQNPKKFGGGTRGWNRVKFHFEVQVPQKPRFLPFFDFEPEQTTKISMKGPLYDNLFSNRLVFNQSIPLKPRKIVKFHEKSQNMKISILMIKASLAPPGG